MRYGNLYPFPIIYCNCKKNYFQVKSESEQINKLRVIFRDP